MGLLDNATTSQSQEYSNSTGGSVGGGLSSSTGWSEGGTYGTGATATAMSYKMMQEANQFNAEQARLNRKWQEKMANTAYQRTMKDLRKAGLNPILAYSNGATSNGSGATASSAMGQAYTDTSNRSYNSAESSNYERSWNESEMRARSRSKSDMANQIGAIAGLIADTVDYIVGEAPNWGNSALATKEAVKDYMKDWQKNNQTKWNNLGKSKTPNVTTSNGSWRSKK